MMYDIIEQMKWQKGGKAVSKWHNIRYNLAHMHTLGRYEEQSVVATVPGRYTRRSHTRAESTQ